jgi:glycosyltransferase involved in cell wall biosynthesis
VETKAGGELMSAASDPGPRASHPHAVDYAVVIPAYNAAATLARALDSVFAQTLLPAEVVVVDDGSPDRSAIEAVVAGYGERIRLLQRKNGGPAAARNDGVRASSSPWIAFLDADDAWLPEKMQRQMELGNDTRAGLLHGCAYPGRPPLPARLEFATLWRQNRICTSMAVVRRTAFEQVGGFDEEPELLGAEDYNLWLRIARAGWSVLARPELLGHYTPAAGSVTSRIERCANAELHNARKLGAAFGLEQRLVRSKILSIRTDFGRHLLYVRQPRAARRMLNQPLWRRPNLERFSLWSATFVPISVMDLRRRLLASHRR